MRDEETILLFAIATFVLAALAGDSIVYGHGLRTLAFPAVLGIATAALCGIRAMQRRRQLRSRPRPDRAPLHARRVALDVAGLLAILPCVYCLGFVLGLPLYVVGSLALRREGLATIAAAAAATLAGATAIIYVFGVAQPRGPLVWP
jgi:hypothetical protein